jgi:hypothetical protein
MDQKLEKNLQEKKPQEKDLEVKDLFLMEIITDFINQTKRRPELIYTDSENYCLLSFQGAQTLPSKFSNIPVMVAPLIRYYPKEWEYVEQPKA